MDSNQLSAPFVAELARTLGAHEPDDRFVERLRMRLASEAPSGSNHRAAIFSRKWAFALSLIAVLAVAAVLVAGPKNVYGSLLRLFGYIPGVGIVNLDEVMVLENGVAQQHQAAMLTVQQGVAGKHDTKLWLKFSSVARPVDGAWLQADNGQRYELIDWRFDPNTTDSQGVLAVFQPLPNEAMATVLALPEGWRIPMQWIPGREANLVPADVLDAAPQETGTPGESHPAVGTAQTGCVDAAYVGLRLKAAVRTETGLQLLLEETDKSGYRRGSLMWHNAVDPQFPETGPWLVDAAGQTYPIDPWRAPQAGALEPNQQILAFSGVPQEAGLLRLVVPDVTVSVDVDEEIVVNVGEHPQAGQVIPLDATVMVEGAQVHFSQAEIRSDAPDSLRLHGLSDEIAEVNGVKPVIFELGRPERVVELYGSGSKRGRISFELELIQNGQLLTGEIRLPVISAAFRHEGPFEISFESPPLSQPDDAQPNLLDPGTYEPLPPAGAMAMDAFRLSGRTLQSGDLLAFSMQGENTRVRVASIENKFVLEDLAVLPGYVLALHPHPDGAGFDYVAANSSGQTPGEYLQQLYRLRFEEPEPRLLVDRFEKDAQGFAWSYDGKYMAYLVDIVQPGQPNQRVLKLLPGGCDDTQTCQPLTMDTGTEVLASLNWASNSYRLAASGTTQAGEAGSTDIFLLTLSEDPLRIEALNLTQSDELMELAPEQWSRNDASLSYICAAPSSMVNNLYGLCEYDFTTGKGSVILPELPWNMHAGLRNAGGLLVESGVVLENGRFGIRTVDLETNVVKYLYEWPFAEKRPYPVAVSADGERLAAFIRDLGGLNIAVVGSEERWQVTTNEDVFRLDWVK